MSGKRDKAVEKEKLPQNKQLEDENSKVYEQSETLMTIVTHQSEPREKNAMTIVVVKIAKW